MKIYWYKTRWYTNINIRPPTKGALTLLDWNTNVSFKGPFFP